VSSTLRNRIKTTSHARYAASMTRFLLWALDKRPAILSAKFVEFVTKRGDEETPQKTVVKRVLYLFQI
jgi:hypothetical protein